ncbi:hypothetical protein [Clostridium tagluense]|uniref:hypothetical protein n=1 Tax=Clostridium tagluense TaxID=360422 RepID=UPI001CF2EED3|nr:hypothetical protein [Clostridium tagluense]MCB2300433.1 hypothetical protein [Clostridium tagluense]
MDEQNLFDNYKKLQSEEWNKEIIYWEDFEMLEVSTSITVRFTWGWLRVYEKFNGDIEWY